MKLHKLTKSQLKLTKSQLEVLLTIIKIVNSLCIFALISIIYYVMVNSHLSMSFDITVKALLVGLFMCNLTLRINHYKLTHIIISYVFQLIACLGIAKFLQVMYVLILDDLAGIVARIL